MRALAVAVHAVTGLVTPCRDELSVGAGDHADLAKAAARSGDSCAAQSERRRGLVRCEVTWKCFCFAGRLVLYVCLCSLCFASSLVM